MQVDGGGGGTTGSSERGDIADALEAPAVMPIVVDGRVVELMTLPQVAARLALPGELGARAPALVSLKRWSAAGALQAAQHFPAGRTRPLYEYSAVREVCLRKLPMRFDDIPAAALARPAVPAGPTHGQARDEAQALEVLRRIETLAADSERRHEELRQTMAEMTQQMARMSAAAENLEHTRRTLMNRYDAEMSGLRTQLENMQAAAKASSGQGMDLAAARLQQAAARIEDALRRSADGP